MFYVTIGTDCANEQFMTTVKSYSVGHGDTFYINHGSDNFTIIDCHITTENKEDILNELNDLSSKKGITRFISTHPDEDHIKGLKDLDDKIDICLLYTSPSPRDRG